MHVVFRFGVYIVTESVMGLWWFRWNLCSLSCIRLPTSLTSSKSYCINYFLFSYQIVLLWFLQMFLLNCLDILFTYIRFNTWIRGRNANTWDSLLYYNCFLGNQKNCWYVVWDYPQCHVNRQAMGNLCGFLLVRFLCGLFPNVRFFHVIFYSVQHDTDFLAVVAFPPRFCAHFFTFFNCYTYFLFHC